MADLLARVRVGIAGWEGGPGVNTLYFSPGTGLSWSLTNISGMATEVHSAFATAADFLPSGCRYEVSPDVDIIDTATGKLQDVYSVTDELPVISANANKLAAPVASAALVRLSTDRFINGRRLIGRLFISPCNTGVFDGAGGIAIAYRTLLEDAFVAMTSGVGPRLAVWHRPTAPLGTGGDWGDVTRVVVPAKGAVLRSRRD